MTVRGPRQQPFPDAPLDRAAGRRRALAACTGAGIALFFTRASLDMVGAPGAETRVAMLPSWPELLGLIVLALMSGSAGVALIAHIDRRARDGALASPEIRARDSSRRLDMFLPLFGLLLLILPYVPWIPDRFPLLSVLAGPARFLLWFLIIGQVVWVAAASIATALGPPPPRRVMAGLPAAVFAAGAIAFTTGAVRLSGTPLFPGGDEPHYLVIMQSLVRDHDLKIENNHRDRDYLAYFNRPLEPHYRTRGVDGAIYSIHPIGLPLIAAPAFALAGYPGVISLLIFMAAGAAALMWRWARNLTGSSGAATFAWAAVALSAPVFFNTFAVYPEIPGALCVMIALGWRSAVPQDGVAAWSARGLAVAALPWLSTKYAPMAFAIAAVLACRAKQSVPARVAVLMPIGISVAGWLLFFHHVWGSFSPSAPYGSDTQTALSTLLAGGPGLLADQEYGLLALAPVLVLGPTGLIAMWRAGGEARRAAIEITIVCSTLLGTVGSFALWWGGSAMAGRPVISAVMLLGGPIAWTYQHALSQPLRRAAHQVLLLASLAVTATLLVAQRGLLLAEGRDGESELLHWLSPNWPFSSLAPSFIGGPVTTALAQTVIWMTAALTVGWLSSRRSHVSPGRAALMAVGWSSAAVLLISIVMPAIGVARPSEPINLEARAHVPLLDRFDATARPLAIRYRPLSMLAPDAVPSLVTLTATPGLRRAPQPVPVLMNARFSLPAGEYRIELRPRSVNPVAPISMTGRLGLQVGRNGAPMETWPIGTAPGDPWSETFTLDVNSTFVAFQASADLAPSIGELRLQPVRVVDQGVRAPTPPVLAAAILRGIPIYFHDGGAYPESNGFWVRGRASMDATMAPRGEGADGVTLQLRSSHRLNTVALATPTWSADLGLRPDSPTTVHVPPLGSGRVIPLHITARDGFVPASLDRGSRDRRMLGCWVTVVR